MKKLIATVAKTNPFSILGVPVTEELTPGQKREVDTWPRARNEFSDHAFGGRDNKRVAIPLVHGVNKAEPPKDIKDHLESHGYTIHDYRGGVAMDKHGRETKIGKALVKTAAPKEMLDRFNSDPNRRVKSDSSMKIIISRHHHDVAGMSTNRGWTSCMNMDGGSNKEYLKHDLFHGTHVAYLVHNHDDEVKNPVARIALKPFISENGHKILRPEARTYGTAGDSFHSTVREWTEKHFPTVDDVYVKHKDLYDDSGDRVVANTHPDAIKRILSANLSEKKGMEDAYDAARRIVLRHGKLDDHIIDHVLQSGNDVHINHIAVNPSLQPHHIDKLIGVVRPSHLTKRADLTEHHVDRILDQVYKHNHADAASSVDLEMTPSTLSKRHLDLLHPDYIAHRHDLHDEHIDKIIKNGNKSALSKLVENPHVTLKPHHVDTLVRLTESHPTNYQEEDNIINIRKNLLDRNDVSDDQKKAIIDHAHDNKGVFGYDSIIARAAESKKSSPAIIDHLIKHGDKNALRIITQRGDLKPHHVEALINHPDDQIVEETVEHQDVKPHHIDRLLDERKSMAESASFVRSPNLQPHHIDRILEKDRYSHEIARNPNLQPHHIDKFMDRFSSYDTLAQHMVFAPLLNSKALRPRHLDKLVDLATDHKAAERAGQTSSLADKVAAHPMLQPHHIDKLLEKPDLKMYRAVAKRTDLQPHHLEKIYPK